MLLSVRDKKRSSLVASFGKQTNNVLQFLYYAVSSEKRNVTVWHPSVHMSVTLAYKTRPAYISARQLQFVCRSVHVKAVELLYHMCRSPSVSATGVSLLLVSQHAWNGLSSSLQQDISCEPSEWPLKRFFSL